MKAFVVRTPGGLGHLEVSERADPGEPGAGPVSYTHLTLPTT